MGSPILVDSNILIYALDDASPKSSDAKKFLENRSLYLIFSHQTLLETMRIVTHKKFPNPYSAKIAALSLTSITGARVLIPPLNNTFDIAQRLILKHNLLGNKIFDAYMTATAISWSIETIATDNERDFKRFREISVYNPFKR